MAAQSWSASPERRRRVVVTGIGPVTPIGAGVEAFWDALLAGRSGITPIEHIDASQLPVKIAGEIHDFDPEAWMSPKEIKRTDRGAAGLIVPASSPMPVAASGKPGRWPGRMLVWGGQRDAVSMAGACSVRPGLPAGRRPRRARRPSCGLSEGPSADEVLLVLGSYTAMFWGLGGRSIRIAFSHVKLEKRRRVPESH